MARALLPTLVCLLALLPTARAQALNIVPTYLDGPGQWDLTGTGGPDRRIPVDAAIDAWESIITDPVTVNVDISFDDDVALGGALGIWSGAISAPAGTNLFPNTSGVTHDIFFNVDFIDELFFDQTPLDDSDLVFDDTDVFSLAAHELGHMLGFTSFFYFADFGDFGSDKWDAQIDLGTGIFHLDDGLGMQDIQMSGLGDLPHLADSGSPGGLLMEPFLFNGERRLISGQEARMLGQAYGYSLELSEPGTLLLAAASILLLLIQGRFRQDRRAFA